LKDEGFICRIERVDTEAGFLQALERGGIDLVLADFSLPECEGLESLRLARQVRPEIPFLIVSGVIGEEAAVDAVKSGATDYVLKDRLSRLVPAVGRALEEAGLRWDRKLLGDQLTRAQKLEIMGELAGGVAHDYNNILTIIMANSGLLMAGLPEGTGLHKNAAQIEYACAHAASLTGQLLSFSRRTARDAGVVDLNGILKNAESMLRRLLPENIELTVTPFPSPLPVIADRGDIEQVLINLVLNARDAIQERGAIRVDAAPIREDGLEFVAFDVKDTGRGMSSRVKAQIFEPFFTTKPEGFGTGLGLATCRRLIESMRGRISVESQRGHGSRFRVLLPRAEMMESNSVEPTERSIVESGSGKILLAEDNHMLRDMIATQLEELGYEVLQAENGIAALEVFTEHKASPPLVLVTDVVLPLLSGRELARLLRKASPSLHVLYTSGHTEQTLAALGSAPSGDEILRKPFTIPELSFRIRELLPAAG
jgi:signal transduction histidine kinase